MGRVLEQYLHPFLGWNSGLRISGEAHVLFLRNIRPVNQSGLTYEEFQQACRACRWIRITRCPQGYLREFLASRVETETPHLAAKIRQLADQEFVHLCLAIKDQQETPR